MSDLIKLFVTSRMVESKKLNRKFPAYKVKMKIVVAGEEKKGRQVKWIDLKFKDEGDNVRKSAEVKRGYIWCKPEEVDTPKKLVIKHDEKTNKDKYPCVWIHSYEKYEPVLVRASQDEFACEEDATDYSTEEEVEPVTTDEESTEDFDYTEEDA